MLTKTLRQFGKRVGSPLLYYRPWRASPSAGGRTRRRTHLVITHQMKLGIGCTRALKAALGTQSAGSPSESGQCSKVAATSAGSASNHSRLGFLPAVDCPGPLLHRVYDFRWRRRRCPILFQDPFPPAGMSTL